MTTLDSSFGNPLFPVCPDGQHFSEGPWAIAGNIGYYKCIHCGKDYMREVSEEEKRQFDDRLAQLSVERLPHLADSSIL